MLAVFYCREHDFHPRGNFYLVRLDAGNSTDILGVEPEYESSDEGVSGYNSRAWCSVSFPPSFPPS
jgi:hypothetical protein